MSLLVHRAVRADRLADVLGDVLSRPLDDPFAQEIVSVPTRGVERWLAQRLSHRLGVSLSSSVRGSGHGSVRADGICAGVSFPSPRRLFASITAAALGADPDVDPWHPDRTTWPLLAVIDASRGQSWARLLWSYLGDRAGTRLADISSTEQPSPTDLGRGESSDASLDPVRSGRRWGTARHLAELFARYADSRPTMVEHWAGGRDLDSQGRQLPPEFSWQAELWRRLHAELGGPDPVARLAEAVERLHDESVPVPVPSRISLFGATRIDAGHLAVLHALATHRDVHLWLPHPSPALWSAVAEHLATGPAPVLARAEDPTAALARHPLLASLGRDARELQLMLSTRDVTDELVPEASGRHPGTLLERLQRDIAANRALAPAETRPLLDEADRSVQVHATHGPDRQVEVLREVLVGLLADDATLEPRDIVVMCPDIERFAPIISAAFGLTDLDTVAEHPGHRLRVRLADRSLRQLNPLLSVLSSLLALVDARISASELLDLCAMPAVARRFAFSEDDVQRLAQLVRQSGVRWGLDAADRRRFGMDAFGQNTWAAGLDRMLLGVAMDEDGQHFIGTALPLDDVDSSDVDLVGRLAELVDRVHHWCRQFAGRHTLTDWVQRCRAAIAGMADVPPNDAWQVSHAHAALGRLLDPADQARPDTRLGLAEIRTVLAEAFRGRATRANFRTGTLTMCTMLPMRSVPHRVVCLLGVDDGVFPRRTRPDGDDISALRELVGDRDTRSEDRQLLLDAVMAAEQHLVVIYSGADARTGALCPPAVPIGELLDALDAAGQTVDGRPVSEHITIRHRLQPFDPDNFTSAGVAATGVAVTGPFSFDTIALRGAEAGRRPRRPSTSPYAPGLLPPLQSGDPIGVSDLTRFFSHPARQLLRTRAGLGSGFVAPELSDQLAVALDGLEAWDIGERLLRLHLRGADLAAAAAAEWRRGTLPPRALGERELGQIVDRVRLVADAARGHLLGEPQNRDVEVELDGRLVVGTVGPVHEHTLVTVSYSTLSAKQRLTAWLCLLALSADHPAVPWRAVTLGRRGMAAVGPVDGGWARLVLADLVDLYLTGLREVIPFSPRTSAEYAQLRHAGASVGNHRRELAKTWAMERDVSWQRVLPPPADLETLMAQPSLAAEQRGVLAEPSRFGTLARRVFHPLLDAELP